MDDAVDKLVVAVDEPEIFDRIQEDALMGVLNPDAGQVMIITKGVERNGKPDTDLIILFPTETGKTPRYQPTGIRLTLNTFLNAARMLALQHGAVITPEAFTDESVPSKVIGPN